MLTLRKASCVCCGKSRTLYVDRGKIRAYRRRRITRAEAFPDLCVSDIRLLVKGICADCFNELVN